MNRSVGSIEQVGHHFIVRSGDHIEPADTPFHGGKKIVNNFDGLVDFLSGHFQIERSEKQMKLEGVSEEKVHRLELNVK